MTCHFAFEGNEPRLSFHRRGLLASAGIAAFAGRFAERSVQGQPRASGSLFGYGRFSPDCAPKSLKEACAGEGPGLADGGRRASPAGLAHHSTLGQKKGSADAAAPAACGLDGVAFELERVAHHARALLISGGRELMESRTRASPKVVTLASRRKP
jgi:hypothetical protein